MYKRQPLTNIPKVWLDWYSATFEKGLRDVPPATAQVAVLIQQIVRVAGSKNFNVRKIVELMDDIIRFDPVTKLLMTGAGIFTINGVAEYALPPMTVPVLGVSPNGKVVSAAVSMGKIKLRDIHRGQDLDCDILADSVMSCEGNIFGKSGDKLFQLIMMEPSGSFLTTTHLVGSISPNSTLMYDGVVFQDLLGAYYASLCPVSKTCYQIHFKELDGKRIVDAKYDSKVLIVVAFSKGKYDKFIFRINEDYNDYDCRVENDVGAATPNFIVMPGTGVVLHLNEKDELELFPNTIGSSRMKVFDDPMLTGDMRLMREGTQAMFSKGNHLYAFEVKKTP